MIFIEKHFKQIEETLQSLPSCLNFKIGEVAKILSTPTHVLRYWEKEFPDLKPQKFINNQRLYIRKDISTLLLIKTLLYEEKFSTEGLKKHLPHYLKQMRDFFQKAPLEDSTTPDEKSSDLEQKAQTLLATLSKIKQELKTKSF